YITVVGRSNELIMSMMSGWGAATYCIISLASASSTTRLLSLGLCLIANTLSTAASFKASQPRPQMVSVGYSMTPPLATALAAAFISGSKTDIFSCLIRPIVLNCLSAKIADDFLTV